MKSETDTKTETKSLVGILGIALSLFQVWAVVFSTLDPLLHRVLFLSWMLTIAFLYGPSGKKISRTDITLAGLSVGFGLYTLLNFARIQYRWPLVDALTWSDCLVAAIVLFLVAESTRRTIGWPIILIAGAFSAYLLLGHRVPGTFSHRYFSFIEFLDQMIFTINGIFGAPLGVSATYVYLFVLFGVFLYHSGGGDFFIDLSHLLAGRTRGGSAKVAVMASGLFGMMSGSPTSDAVTTGTFTVPLMKRMGYSANAAGAIVAAGATGGSIMPPVMGSAAFLMVEMTGISYLKILAAASLPALLYYWSLIAQVHFGALKSDFRTEALPSGGAQAVLRNLHFLIPLVVLVVSLIRGDVPTHAATWAILATIVVSWFRKETRMTPQKIALALAQGARASIVVATATASAGIVVGTIAYSGIGGKFTGLLLGLAGQSLLPVLLLAMVICVILGMGMPVPSAYILTAVLIGPALAGLGLPTMAAHLFIVYYSVMSAITPPVAVAAYAVAGVAGGNPNRIGFRAVRLALVAFLVPFVFVYSPELLLLGRVRDVLLAVPTALIGVTSLAAGLEGWLFRRTTLWERGLLLGGGVVMILPGIATDLIGALLVLAVVIVQKRVRSGDKGLANFEATGED